MLKPYVKILLIGYLISLITANELNDELNVPECKLPCHYDNYVVDCTGAQCTSAPPTVDTSWHVYDILSRNKMHMASLIMAQNPIDQIASFDKYTHLKYLDLSYCTIQNITTRAFEQLESLQRLNLGHNKLSRLNREQFHSMEHLTQLDLNHNQIRMVYDNVFYEYLKGLERLDLSYNVITNISANAFTDLLALRFLHLNNNKLVKIDAKDFLGLTRLENFHLQHNQIRIVPAKCFYECVKLQTLDLSYNRIIGLDKSAFDGLSHLKILKLDGNQIKWFEAATFAEPLGVLEDLYLDANPIERLGPNRFPPNIQKISMTELSVLNTIGDGVFSNLTMLRSLRISGCKNLEQIKSNAFDGNATSAFTYLDLSNNSLRTLNENLVNWSTIEELVLGENKFACDCDMAWVKDTLPQEVQRTVKCAAPHHLHGHAINDVDFTQFSCAFYDVHRGGIEAGLILFVTTCFVCLASLLVYKFRHTVFPCFYDTPGRYSTMYDAVNTEEDNAVQVKIEKTKSKEAPPPPTAV